MLRQRLFMTSGITMIQRQGNSTANSNGLNDPNSNGQNYTDQSFVSEAKSRLDRLGKNRTMSLRKGSFQSSLGSYEELSKVNMPVDSVVGILGKRKMSKKSSEVDEKLEQRVQSQRDMSKNLDKKLNEVAGSSYFSEDSSPTNCQYTKELEVRDCKAEDKLLKFPIDNESVVWEESHVPFTDHIFLNKYLVLFPPVTHRFMETIITALQNNPDLTADKKKQIIWSYLNYFTYHSELLEEDEEDILKI